jgi:drug/metabolite transporter (DMT)-like permease
MSIFFLSIILTVISNVLYHIFIKILPAGIHPAVSLVILYGSALLVCLLYLFFFPPAEGLLTSFQKISWANVGVGLAIVGLELGFILAYRAGWNISLAGIVSATAVAIILLPIGFLIFKERISPLNLLGVGLCIGGLLLVNIGK